MEQPNYEYFLENFNDYLINFQPKKKKKKNNKEPVLSNKFLKFGSTPTKLCPVRKTVTETITLTNPSSKKIQFNFNPIVRPTFELSISPQQGNIGKKKQIQVKFQITVLCTTFIKDFLICELVGLYNQFLFLDFESELSLTLNYDELEFGNKVGEGGSCVVFKGKYRNKTVAIKQIVGEEKSELEILWYFFFLNSFFYYFFFI